MTKSVLVILFFVYVFLLIVSGFLLPTSDFVIMFFVSSLVFIYIYLFRIYNIYNHFDERRVFFIFMAFCLIIFFLSIILALASNLSAVVSKSPIELNSLTASLNLSNSYYNETTIVSNSIPEHGLYRFWNTSVYIYSNDISEPGLYVVGHRSKYPFFVKTDNGNIIMTEKDQRIKSLIEEYVPDNSVGIYTTNGKIEPGDHKFTTDYYFHLPVYCDKHDCFLNFWVYGGVVGHLNLSIDGHIIKIKTSPGLSVKKGNNITIIHGDNVIGPQVMVLFKKPKHMSFYVKETKNATLLWVKTSSKFGYNTIYIGTIVLILLFLALLVLTYIIYRKYGCESEVVVPEYLNYVPDKDKNPWEVNYYYVNDGKSTDVNGFLATLLDLKRKGKIDFKRIEEKGIFNLLRHKKKIIIKILNEDTEGLDPYEKEVLVFLLKESNGNEVDIKELCKKARIDPGLRNRFYNLVHYKPFKPDIFDRTGYYIIITLSLAIVSIGVVVYWLFLNKYYRVFGIIPPMLGLVIGMIGLAICNILSPMELFARWRNNEYENKLKWMAFGRFLKDMAMIKKYNEDAINQWKEWLIYGVALGIGKKVLKNLKNVLQDLSLPEEELYDLDLMIDLYYIISNSLISLSMPDTSFLTDAIGGITGGDFGGIGGGCGGGGVGGF